MGVYDPSFGFYFAVTFSRLDPEGKLVMGFRKAMNSVPLQVKNPSLSFSSICLTSCISTILLFLPVQLIGLSVAVELFLQSVQHLASAQSANFILFSFNDHCFLAMCIILYLSEFHIFLVLLQYVI